MGTAALHYCVIPTCTIPYSAFLCSVAMILVYVLQTLKKRSKLALDPSLTRKTVELLKVLSRF